MDAECVQMTLGPLGKVSELSLGHSLTTEGKNQSLTSTGLIISRVMKCYFLNRAFTILEKLFLNQSE